MARKVFYDSWLTLHLHLWLFHQMYSSRSLHLSVSVDFKPFQPLPLLPWPSDLWTLWSSPMRVSWGISSLKPQSILFLEFSLCHPRTMNSIRAGTVFISLRILSALAVLAHCVYLQKMLVGNNMTIKVSIGTWTLTWQWISCSSDGTSERKEAVAALLGTQRAVSSLRTCWDSRLQLMMNLGKCLFSKALMMLCPLKCSWGKLRWSHWLNRTGQVKQLCFSILEVWW